MTREDAMAFWQELRHGLQHAGMLQQPPSWRRRRVGEMRVTITERRAMQAFHLLRGEQQDGAVVHVGPTSVRPGHGSRCVMTGDVTLHTLRHTALNRIIANRYDDNTVMAISAHRQPPRSRNY